MASVLEKPFFDTHADALHDLFVALGREARWRDNPEALLPYTQTRWVGREHGNSGEKDQFTPDQEEAALRIMPRLGLRHEVRPPAAEYEQLVIVGGMMRVNRERIGFMKALLDTGGVRAEQVVFWAGQRPRDDRDVAQLAAMDLPALSADRWVRDEIIRPETSAWERGFATETELARLAYLETFPAARLDRVSLTVPRPSAPDVPGRDITSYTFTADGYPEFVLMNCAAVERPAGSPRHTTESCASEWLRTMPPSENAGILVVAGNPHTLRTGWQVGDAAVRHGREDIRLELSGPAASPDASVQLYLGEIGRLLYVDVAAGKTPVTSSA